MWLAIVLQSAFTGKILCKGYEGEGFGKIELVRIDLRALIIDRICTEVLSRLLILTAFVPISIMSVCLVRAGFLIFFHRFIVSKLKPSITLGYIVEYVEVLERSIFMKKYFQSCFCL